MWLNSHTFKKKSDTQNEKITHEEEKAFWRLNETEDDEGAATTVGENVVTQLQREAVPAERMDYLQLQWSNTHLKKTNHLTTEAK